MESGTTSLHSVTENVGVENAGVDRRVKKSKSGKKQE